MDDYLSKPVEINELERVLKKFLIGQQQFLVNQNIASCSAQISTPKYDIESVAKELQLDKTTMQLLFDNFFIHLDEKLKAFEDALEKKASDIFAADSIEVLWIAQTCHCLSRQACH